MQGKIYKGGQKKIALERRESIGYFNFQEKSDYKNRAKIGQLEELEKLTNVYYLRDT